MKIIAFDLSLTATGYATKTTVGLLKAPELRGLDRLRWIRDNVLTLAAGADLVVLEGYSFGSGHQAHQMGELGGVVRLGLYDEERNLVIVPPSCRAKYATGKGNASKEAVLAEAIRRLKYTGHDHNEADAMWLLAMARDHYEPWRPPVPAAHRVALKALEWPKLQL